MITKHGKSAQRRSDCPSFFESTRDPISVLVFSLRSKRRFTKARLEAAQWVMRTIFEAQSFCDSLQARRFLFHSCTPDIPVALTHDSDAPFNVTLAVSLPWMAPGLRQATAPLVHSKCGFGTTVSLVGSFCLLQGIVALIPIPHVVSRVKTTSRLHLRYTTWTSLLVVVGQVYCVGHVYCGRTKRYWCWEVG